MSTDERNILNFKITQLCKFKTVINGLSAEHLLSWEITFFHSLAYAGINGNTKLKEAVLNMGNKFQLVNIFAATAGIGSVVLISFLTSFCFVTSNFTVI